MCKRWVIDKQTKSRRHCLNKAVSGGYCRMHNKQRGGGQLSKDQKNQILAVKDNITDLLDENLYPDWDDANMAPLWMRAAVLAGTMSGNLEWLQQGYEKVGKIPSAPVVAAAKSNDIIALTEAIMLDLKLAEIQEIGI